MKSKNIKSKIKEYFMENPTEKLRVRQIERKLKVPLPSVIRYTKELEQEHILQKEQIANITLFCADRNSKEFLREKTFFNIIFIHKSGLIDYLIKEFGNPTIVLFGSYSRGEDTESSDIDIYIESSSKQKPNSTKYKKILKKEIQLFIYSNIKKVPNPHLANNIINGIKLNGFIEVFDEK